MKSEERRVKNSIADANHKVQSSKLKVQSSKFKVKSEGFKCFRKGMSMKNLIINILEAAAFLLLGLGVSLFG